MKGNLTRPAAVAEAVLALDMRGVGLDYPTRPGVLAGIHLQVWPQQVAILRGRSGSGKSSLLQLAAGLERASTGSIAVQGEPMPTSPDAAAELRFRHIGLVFQHLNLLGELNVRENVELPLRLRRVGRDERTATTNALLQRFGLHDVAERRPASLSGGEQQRVAIARALAPAPALLLVDEPTSNLDLENARMVVAALQEAARGGAAVLVATHDEVFRGAGTAYRLIAGRLAAEPVVA
jgi:putative ABC transport system ATP-binding protein